MQLKYTRTKNIRGLKTQYDQSTYYIYKTIRGTYYIQSLYSLDSEYKRLRDAKLAVLSLIAKDAHKDVLEAGLMSIRFNAIALPNAYKLATLI